MDALELLKAAQRQIEIDTMIRAFAELADNISKHRPTYWRWTSHLAAGIALRQNGLAP